MTVFYYYENSEKTGPVSSGRLKDLARNGEITPDTVIEHENGTKRPAKKLAGLYFPFQEIDEDASSIREEVSAESQELLGLLIDNNKTFFPSAIKEVEFQKDYPTLSGIISHARHYAMVVKIFFAVLWAVLVYASFDRLEILPAVWATIFCALACKIIAEFVILLIQMKIEKIILAIRTEINTRK